MSTEETTTTQGQMQDPIIKVGEKEHKYSELTDEQKLIVNHVADLNGKIASAKFNLEQLEFAKLAFEDRLTKSLEEDETTEEEE